MRLSLFLRPFIHSLLLFNKHAQHAVAKSAA